MLKGLATKAIHGTNIRKEPHGTLRVPVYDNVAFEFENSRDIQLAFEGRKFAHSYTRISNPTVQDFEDKLRLVSDSLGVLAVSSGMAAISNAILTLAEAGTNIVASNYLFGNTYSLFEDTLKPWGLDVRYVDMTDLKQLTEAIDGKTRAIFLEVITNPQLQVADIEAVTRVAHQHGVPVVLDGTVTTPFLFKSKDFGVDVEVISSTKYLSGGATSVGGVIIDNGLADWGKNPRLEEWAGKYGPQAFLVRLRREVYRNVGACLSPHNAFLQTLGLETAALRIERSCANALNLARLLKAHPKVQSVEYPGLETSASYAIVRKQFPRGSGGILVFHLRDRDECYRFMDRLQLIKRATNINDNKTMVIHPASTIFGEYTPELKAQMGVGEGLIRLSVGIEDLEDLEDDLNAALEVL